MRAPRKKHSPDAIARSRIRSAASLSVPRRHRARDSDTVPCAALALNVTTASVSPTGDTLLCEWGAPSDARPTVPVPSDGRMERLRDRMAKGDWGGALLLAETLLEDDPSRPEARSAQRICRCQLLDGLDVRNLARVPRVAMSLDRVSKLPLDHREGFVLSLVDGRSTVDDLVDASGLSSGEVVEIVARLEQAGAITLPLASLQRARGVRTRARSQRDDAPRSDGSPGRPRSSGRAEGGRASGRPRVALVHRRRDTVKHPTV